MCQDSNEIKSELAKLARQKNKRDVSIGPEEPAKWWPTSVKDPRGGKPFTYAGSWDFIAEQLDKKETSIEQKKLKKPCGKLAYVLKILTEYGIIYIKVSLANGKIIGRSFHY